jgi:hypothetical protein
MYRLLLCTALSALCLLQFACKKETCDETEITQGQKNLIGTWKLRAVDSFFINDEFSFSNKVEATLQIRADGSVQVTPVQDLNLFKWNYFFEPKELIVLHSKNKAFSGKEILSSSAFDVKVNTPTRHLWRRAPKPDSVLLLLDSVLIRSKQAYVEEWELIK